MVREDPGAVLLVVRHTTAFATPSSTFSPTTLLEPSLAEAALHGLRTNGGAGFVDWGGDAVYDVALGCARAARRVAEATGRCSPDHAWVGGLLAPLGWLGVCAVNPEDARACLADPHHDRHPSAVERRRWGFDQTALARRLARRWHLPPWLAAVVGYLALPAEDVRRHGGSPDLSAVVRLAVALSQRNGAGLRLATGATVEEASAALGLAPAELEALAADGRAAPPGFQAPASLPLLTDLLALAAENRRLRDVPLLRRLEAETDALADTLQEVRCGEAERLRAHKLAGLAELAAGAGHEINNPLAVISGQAQFLLNKLHKGERKPAISAKEAPAASGEAITEGLPGTEYSVLSTPSPAASLSVEAEPALRTIIEQAQRIHQILRELMQFARPPKPRKQPFDAGDLVREVATSLSELAARRHVRLVVPRPERPVSLCADPAQVRTALACLLRNAVEAAPAEGWAGVRLETASPGAVEFVVEDNGTGPPPAQREHLFDPFYSGRTAGRGRGFGLPTAWRLARQHGGDVAFVGLPDGPTRFVLSLPAEPPAAVNGNGHAHRDAIAG
jgi:signal transduction histidine kinase